MPHAVRALAAITFLLAGFASAKAELLVNISKSQQRLSVVVDGTEAYRWPVSTGTRGHETPVGSFRPHDLERHWYSRQYRLTPMPWAVFFHRGYAVHGTMEAYNLGHPASHGCVRLRPDNASILYSLVRRYGMSNTRVVVDDGPLRVAPGPMARSRSFERDRGFERFGMPAPRRVTQNDETPRRPRATERGPSRGEESSREAWLRSLDRKYGINTR